MNGRKRLAGAAALALVLAAGLSLAPVAANAATATVPMYRLYNRYSGAHLYTANAAERDSLAKVGWTREGVGWVAPKSSKTPVYRLYNKWSGDHHYTTNKAEYDALGRAGWNREGVGFYSDDAKGTPLYRQFNPYERVGTHNYTTSKVENDQLVKIGWKAEGIGWYGVKASGGDTGSTSKPGNNGSTQRPTTEYDYDISVINPKGLYNGSTVYLYIKTKIPTGKFSVGATGPGSVSEYVLDGIDDIRAKRDVDSNMMKLDSGNGYVQALSFSKPGDYVLSVYEQRKGTSYWDSWVQYKKTFKIHVNDYEAAENAWIDSMIAKYTNSSMTNFQKVDRLGQVFRDGVFKYLPNDSGRYLLTLAGESGPYFVTYRWDSAISPAVLCKIAERVGGFDDIHNCYGDYPYGSADWANNHYYVRLRKGSEEFYVYGCPPTSSGTIDKINYLNL